MKTNFDEEIEKYPDTPDWFLIVAIGFLVGFGIAMLIVLQ